MDIFVVDSITVAPGGLHEVWRRYTQIYVPLAEARGMVLKSQLISPPVALQPALTNTLSFVWLVEGVQGWWQMRLGAAFDPQVKNFWVDLAPFVESRSRVTQGEAANYV